MRFRSVENEREQLRRESNDVELAYRIGIIQHTLQRSDQGVSTLPRNRP